jgi:hypothetical protein
VSVHCTFGVESPSQRKQSATTTPAAPRAARR